MSTLKNYNQKLENYGFIRVGAAVPVVSVADTFENTHRITALIDEAVDRQIALVVFPELCVTGYTCGDLFFQNTLLHGAEEAVKAIAAHTQGLPITVVIGAPVSDNGRLYNCAIAINDGRILGMVPKTYLPNYNEFSEFRWFCSGSDFISKYGSDGSLCKIDYAGQDTLITPNQLFRIGDASFGIEICEDVWAPIPCSSYLAIEGAQIVVNPSASNEVVAKSEYRKQLIKSQTAQRIMGYVYCSAGYGESTTNSVFAGASMIYENGAVLAEGKSFSMQPQLTAADIDVQKLEMLRCQTNTFCGVTPDGDNIRGFKRFFTISDCRLAPDTDFGAELLRPRNPEPFLPRTKDMDQKCNDALEIQAIGLASRLEKIHCRKVIIGISGGLDSTLALLCSVRTFDKLGWPRKDIIGVTMPGFGTSDRTHNNASDLMEQLGITSREISIAKACRQHFEDLGHDGKTQDVAYENAQARERTQILMDMANMENAIVVGTGDLSELALGWCTYNGDHMSNYSVNATIPKTMVRVLVDWAAGHMFEDPAICHTLRDIVDTPVSPELKGDGSGIEQKTEDIVGPYELHDYFIYYMVRYGFSPAKIVFMALKAFDGRYDEQTIRKWMKVFLRRFFSQQFKRSCSPDGPKVGPISLDPRYSWRMPSDAQVDIWMKEIE